MTRAIIYDFDGVICDSVQIKTEAFVELYTPFGEEKASAIKEYHLAHGGVSRFEKFRHWHKKYLDITLSDDEVMELAEQFSALVKQKVIASPYISGAQDYLNKHQKNYQQFICTGTPTNEIEEILNAKKIRSLFTDVFGSPQKKIEILQRIMDQYQLISSEMIYFGDATTDLDAANHFDIPFIGINAVDIDKVCIKYHTFEDISDIPVDELYINDINHLRN